VLGLPALLDVIVIEYALHGFLEKAAGPLGCLSTLHFLPHFSPAGVSLPRLTVQLSCSGLAFAPTMDRSSPTIPALERVIVDRPSTWLSPLSVTAEERPVLLREIAGPFKSSRSSTPTPIAETPMSFAVYRRPPDKIFTDAHQEIRLSDAIESAYPAIDEDGGSPLRSSVHKKTTSPGAIAPAGDGHGKPLVPTHIGYLEKKEDALRLLEGCFRGILYHSFRDPRGVASGIRSGYIFIWEQEISAVQYWDDGISWTPVDCDGGFWISRGTNTGDGLMRKAISVPALGRFHHVVSYYDPWDTVNGTLIAPSRDPKLKSMTLRTELASQLTMPSPSTKYSRLLLEILKVKLSSRITLSITIAHDLQTCSPTGLLQLMRTALLLCLCYTDEGLHEYLLQRKPGDWFPHVPSNPAYWHELSSRDLFQGTKPRELKTQMKLLLLKLIEYSTDRTSSRLLRDQPCKTFSAMQNRSLYGEIFRVSHGNLVSVRPFDPARLSTDLARSVLFQQCPVMDPTDVEKWKSGLARLLPVDPPGHNVGSRDSWMRPALTAILGLALNPWCSRASGYRSMREHSDDQVKKGSLQGSISNW